MYSTELIFPRKVLIAMFGEFLYEGMAIIIFSVNYVHEMLKDTLLMANFRSSFFFQYLFSRLILRIEMKNRCAFRFYPRLSLGLY